MILLVLWEAGRSCGLAYPLSATLSLIGAEGVFLLYSRSQTEGQRLLTCIPAMLLCYWCFGYGAWLCLALMLAAGIIAHHQKLSALLAVGILLLPATQYPATTWWSKPDLDREYVLSLDVEHYFGNIQKMRKHLETDRQILWVTYYRNLYNATHPSEINSPVSLSRNLLAWNQPGTNGLILPVNPSASFLSILFANELWFTLGDMTMAEHCAMLSMIFSPRNSGSRMIKRLAEINLVNGDDEAALKYLRILDKTLLHKSWAEKRIPGQQTPQVKEWLEKKRRDIPTQDQLRRGEGLGYYGLANNIAMSIGPMFGLFLHNAGESYTVIFSYALGACILGLLAASMVKTTYRPPVKHDPISLDRFILLKGIPAGISLLLLSIPYGMTTNYVAMYARQIGITAETGFFFTCMALGMAVSRLFSGRLVDKGLVTQVISAGLYLVCFCYFSLTACGWLVSWNLTATTVFFFVIALLLGIGFGTMFPAYNTLFVNLAPNSQRGTATSTYLTSWDVGLGIGMLTGGYIAEIASFRMAYLFGSALTVVSMIYFRVKAGPHFLKNKLR